MAAFDGLPQDAVMGLHRQALAAVSAPGSIAARNDPNQDGSILSRQYPGLFGQFGASNPTFQESQARFNGPRTPFDFHTPGVEEAYGLRRPGAQSSMNPMFSQMMMQSMYGGQPQTQQQSSEDGDNGYGY
jgi:hypothetical protein